MQLTRINWIILWINFVCISCVCGMIKLWKKKAWNRQTIAKQMPHAKQNKCYRYQYFHYFYDKIIFQTHFMRLLRFYSSFIQSAFGIKNELKFCSSYRHLSSSSQRNKKWQKVIANQTFWFENNTDSFKFQKLAKKIECTNKQRAIKMRLITMIFIALQFILYVNFNIIFSQHNEFFFFLVLVSIMECLICTLKVMICAAKKRSGAKIVDWKSISKLTVIIYPPLGIENGFIDVDVGACVCDGQCVNDVMNCCQWKALDNFLWMNQQE